MHLCSRYHTHMCLVFSCNLTGTITCTCVWTIKVTLCTILCTIIGTITCIFVETVVCTSIVAQNVVFVTVFSEYWLHIFQLQLWVPLTCISSFAQFVFVLESVKYFMWCNWKRVWTISCLCYQIIFVFVFVSEYKFVQLQLQLRSD